MMFKSMKQRGSYQSIGFPPIDGAGWAAVLSFFVSQHREQGTDGVKNRLRRSRIVSFRQYCPPQCFLQLAADVNVHLHDLVLVFFRELHADNLFLCLLFASFLRLRRCVGVHSSLLRLDLANAGVSNLVLLFHHVRHEPSVLEELQISETRHRSHVLPSGLARDEGCSLLHALDVSFAETPVTIHLGRPTRAGALALGREAQIVAERVHTEHPLDRPIFWQRL
mmetsp:Transcript_58029/g.155028  ORF Transcript_58029/g.155028 Transcript_58029/m.155028 type:complete len:223 (-) Transcript_58029:1002-1670(-)